MSTVLKNLKVLGDKLEAGGFEKSASTVTNSMDTVLQMKVAQYVGAQGYWIRNRRCWDNCYRQGRVASPEKAAQEVYFDCWDEYLESINNDDSGWEKYADDDGAFLKTADDSTRKAISKEKVYFHNTVKKLVDDGETVPNAVYSTIENAFTKHQEALVDTMNNLVKVADHLHKEGETELSEATYDACLELLKEAQAQWGGGFGGGDKPGFISGLKGSIPAGLNRLFYGKEQGRYRNITARIKRIIDAANGLLQGLYNKGYNAQKDYEDETRAIQTSTKFNLKKIAARRRNPGKILRQKPPANVSRKAPVNPGMAPNYQNRGGEVAAPVQQTGVTNENVAAPEEMYTPTPEEAAYAREQEAAWAAADAAGAEAQKGKAKNVEETRSLQTIQQENAIARNDALVKFRSNLQNESAWLSQVAANVMQESPQTAQTIQQTLTAIQDFHNADRGAKQMSDVSAALEGLVSSLTNSMAGLNQSEAQDGEGAVTDADQDGVTDDIDVDDDNDGIVDTLDESDVVPEDEVASTIGNDFSESLNTLVNQVQQGTIDRTQAIAELQMYVEKLFDSRSAAA